MPDTCVTDCSVAAKWLLPEPEREAALRLFDRYVAGEIISSRRICCLPNLPVSYRNATVARKSRRSRHSRLPVAEPMRFAFVRHASAGSSCARYLPPISVVAMGLYLSGSRRRTWLRGSYGRPPALQEHRRPASID